MPKGTSCKDAIKQFEAKAGIKASEAKRVTLFCQIPPMNKMDNKLNELAQCEHLALSTNAIEKIGPLPGLQNLKILSLARNNIRKVEKLEEVAGTLEELWLSYNQIEKLSGLSSLQNLRVLYLSNNKIKSLNEVGKLGELKSLEEVLLLGNPIYNEGEYADIRVKIIHLIPQLKKLDQKVVSAEEREAASKIE